MIIIKDVSKSISVNNNDRAKRTRIYDRRRLAHLLHKKKKNPKKTKKT